MKLWRKVENQMRLLLLSFTFLALAVAQSSAPLRLEKVIPLVNVRGRIDHMFFDAKTNRLFVAALGNNTVEVIDIEQAKRVHSISGLHEPQGILFLPHPNRLYVANAGDGTLQIFDGSSYRLLKTVKLGDDADNIRYDASAHQVYVGYGNGALAVLTENGNKVSEIKLDAHPESFRLEKSGPRIFVNLPDSRKVAVVDRNTKSEIASWATGAALSNYPMTLDEKDRRVFIVCRDPARLLVLNTETGKSVKEFPVVGDSDDVFYDESRKRLYATGGEGAVSVYQQQDPDHYKQIANIPTAKGARTSWFSPDQNRLFVAARRQGAESAAIRVYVAQIR
jgi:DNA-binding beta-propeller fold protein YncE